ncbi:hypothetical protein GCM10018966_044720 [Streptomyces yanii]
MTTMGTAGADEADESYANELPVRSKEPGNVVVRWMTTTDHKTIGTLYLVTSFAFFVVGGVMALIMRAELARPARRSCRTSSSTSCSRCTARSCC